MLAEVDRNDGTRFNFDVPDVLAPAPSGRAKCRGCGRPIAKGELRFGESFANPYAEGEAQSWFHVPCAALMRPERLLPVLDAAGQIDDREWLRTTAEFGVAHHRLPRLAGIERASSGRATCRSCREPIAKDSYRLRLQMFEEGRVNPIGTIHLTCAGAYFGTRDLIDRLAKLAPELDAGTLAKVGDLVRAAPLAKAEAPRDAGERKSG